MKLVVTVGKYTNDTALPDRNTRLLHGAGN